MRTRSERGAAQPASDVFLGFTSSVAFDRRLWRYDIAGSIAHAELLADAGIVSGEDLGRMSDGLRGIAKDIAGGKLTLDLSAEDIHMAVEKLLTDRIGDAGARLHTGRSRNDQVALDVRLYTREAIADLEDSVLAFQKVLLERARGTHDHVLPGFTHLQHGQPVLMSHHLMAYFWKLQRDADRLADCYERTNISPLGSGALAGTAFPLDRGKAAQRLRMAGVTENSLDAVSDRDFVAESAFVASLIAIHLSSLCEELIIWSSQEFGYVRLPEELSGGSSMMPQKRNPDIPELVRAKSGRVLGDLVTILTMLKSLPLAYNRDLQEDKENLFDVFDTVGASLRALTHFLQALEFDRVRMRESAETGLMTATDLADFLTSRGMPFRKAHGLVAEISASAEGDDERFRKIALERLSPQMKRLGLEGLDFLTVENALARRNVVGGTAMDSVAKQMKEAEERLRRSSDLLEKMRGEASAVDELLA